jgi:hypothetical protein
MAEQVNIASLTIEVDDVIKESVRLKKEIKSLTKQQKELKEAGEDTSEEFIKNEASIKNLSKAYRDNQNFAAALEATNEDLNKTLEVQGRSTQELYDSRRQLQQIAKNIQGDTEEEIELRNQLNEAIDAQTEALRDQSAEYIQGKDQIGEYTQGINASDLSIQSLIKNSKEAGGATNLLKGGFKAAKAGIISFTKAGLAFLATPIGAVIALLAGAFALVKNAMDRSEESTNRVRRAFGGFTGIIRKVFKFLEPLGELIIDGIVVALEFLEKQLIGTINNLSRFLKDLGFDEAAADVAGFSKEVQIAALAGKKLVEAELELDKANRKAQRTQLEFQKRAEKLRQVRDDERKSISERIAANEELGKVLQEQLAAELKIAQKALEVANLRIIAEGKTKEALDERADALTNIADIQERITGQESEQLTNLVSLRREASEKYIEQKEAELEIFRKSQELIDKTIEDQLETERQAANKSLEIAKKRRNSGLSTSLEYANEVKNIELDLAKTEQELAEQSAQAKIEASEKASEAAIKEAQRELNSYIRFNQSKLDSDKFLTEQATQEEVKRLEQQAEKRREFEALRLAEGRISEIEFNDAINQINDENQEKIDTLSAARKEAEKAQKAIDAENELVFLEDQGGKEFEVLQTRLENERIAEVQAAEQTGADVNLINEKFAQREVKLQKSIDDAKKEGFKQVFDSYASILGEQTAAGKAAAVASTLISTYQGAQASYTSLAGIPVVGVGLGLAAAGAAVAAGLKQVGEIAGVPTTFSKGDILKGRSHALGGIPFSIGGMLGFEAEGGEALINKKSTAMFAPILSEINAAGGGKRFAAGGITGSTSSVPSGSLVNYDLLATSIAEANKNLPPAKISVEEINTVQNNLNVVENFATT